MTFDESVATQPAWVQYWLMAMGLVILATVIVLVFSKATRRDALVIVLTMAAAYVAMQWLYGQVGYVRLLGVVHVVLWTPLAVYLWRRLNDTAIGVPFRQIIWLFLVTILVSLAFDYTDVVRYALGERGSMVPA